MKTSTSVEPTDHKKTKHKLKKFLSGRPTLQSIRDKGYIKGNTKARAGDNIRTRVMFLTRRHLHGSTHTHHVYFTLHY